LKQGKKSVNAMADFAEILGQKSDWEAAVELYQKILKLNSNSADADAYVQVGIAFREIDKS
jgi:tetratricopeptide (TPR) repeat protein